MVVITMKAPWRRTPPRLPGLGTAVWRGAAACGAVVVVFAGGLSGPYTSIPAPTQGAARAGGVTTGAAFRQIILPDLVVTKRTGLADAGLARLAGRVRGVSDVLPVDGATITVGGRPVNVLGVDPQRFRSWTPLRTASRQRLWTALGNGEFLASPSARHLLGLRTGGSYHLSGADTATLTFGGWAPLGVRGIGLVVSDRLSAPLGLIHNVAALISAPGTAMPALRREVRSVAGPGATLTTTRPRRLPVERAAASGRPANYLQLFQQSAAEYCPGLSWTVLAAIGQIESGFGANNGPSRAGALGPMQFLPATWKMWGISAFGERGPPNVMDPYDAVPSAARYLCAAGAGSPAGLPRAIYAYNHATWYVAEVLALAHEYARAYG
jgi:Transglycosylase SLT domain